MNVVLTEVPKDMAVIYSARRARVGQETRRVRS